MATAKDIATVIQSALDEIGVTGELDVAVDGQRVSRPLGTTGGDDVQVDVVVQDTSIGC